MKRLLGIASLILCLFPAAAQTNAPVQLALISLSADAAMPVDLLTAQLSGNSKLHLLERDAVNKVYQEQGLSAANRDDLKLGRLLGADGLMLLTVVRTPESTNLTARLIAVKPGVILTEASFPWPLKDAPGWSASVTADFDKFVPKLALLSQNAIPISLVNLRSAIQSEEEKQTEHDLKLLAIQRLSQEPQLFVLERQKMQLLSDEKELKSDESSFWDGSYLLEGVVDQNGYSKDVLTIDARLTPPKGGQPILFQVTGSRTNLADAVNALALKVADLLKVVPGVRQWNAADEARQYFDEANWALKWGVFGEAQAAADSAWALGKQDADCAVTRIKSYTAPLQVRNFQTGEYTNPQDTNAVIQSAVGFAAPEKPWGLALRGRQSGATVSFKYVYAYKFPDPAELDQAIRALELYYSFSRNAPDGLIAVASEQSQWKNSRWYDLGIEDLAAASSVLQHFNFVPDASQPVADKLGELRALARQVAGWISQSAPVHDSYYVGDRLATYDELANAMDQAQNIFRCQVTWGCYWQERPEDAVALYRELISSPVFCYIHSDFWLRDLQTPRLVAWSPADQQRIPLLWTSFQAELAASTNVLCRLEASALALADADNDQAVAGAFTNLFTAIFDNQDAMVKNNADITYLAWHLESLVSATTGNGVLTDQLESLNQLYWSQYRARFDAMETEYRTKTVAAGQFGTAFSKQKKFLAENQPYDFFQFADLFGSRDYSNSQAAEILPLVMAYKAGLVAQSQTASGIKKADLMSAISQVGLLENDVVRILSQPDQLAGAGLKREPASPVVASKNDTPPPSSPKARVPTPVAVANPPAVSTASTSVPVPARMPESISNLITVTKFSALPWDKLVHLDTSETINTEFSRMIIKAHHCCEGKLLLDFQYKATIQTLVGPQRLVQLTDQSGAAIAVFDPASEYWEVVDCPGEDINLPSHSYNRSVLFQGELYNSTGGAIKKYNRQSQQWDKLEISDGNDYELFSVGAHLYAADNSMIFEIQENGHHLRILASSRRRPPVSRLDSENLGTPTLFEGPNHSLRISAGDKIFESTGDDWREVCSAPPANLPLVTGPAGVLFLTDGWNLPPQVSFLESGSDKVEFSLGRNTPGKWKLPSGLALQNLSAAASGSNLCLLVDHSTAQNIQGEHGISGERILPQDGYHAELLCFSPDQSSPQKLLLKFDAPDACPPLAGISPSAQLIPPSAPPSWIMFGSDSLFFGLENPGFAPGKADSIGLVSRPGIWWLPISQISAARASGTSQ